jgi:hypothetical protein
MDAPLAPLLEFEVLDRIGDVRSVSVNSCFGESLVQKPARRTDEWPSGSLLHVSWLFADECDSGANWTFAEHCARRVGYERFRSHDGCIQLGKTFGLSVGHRDRLYRSRANLHRGQMASGLVRPPDCKLGLWQIGIDAFDHFEMMLEGRQRLRREVLQRSRLPIRRIVPEECYSLFVRLELLLDI